MKPFPCLRLAGLAAAFLGIAALSAVPAAAPMPDRGPLALHSEPGARFDFQGPIGARVHANIDLWLLTAPQANPGMLDMFRVRDRTPTPQLVPWAGEFVGKYLISAIQALRMSDDPRLRAQVSNVVTAFIATQADDGYLGPFPRDIRLLKNWDLWGHYHAILALVMWHEHTGDPAALAVARKAAELACSTYLGTGRRVIEAGDPEMNMAIGTALGLLHRLTGEPRYLDLANEVAHDWERAGDYLRSGLDGREFFQSPRPRWESLHSLQGLLELWRITGDARYHDAFVHHWRSIRRWDRRNTGAFSSGEQATGNPYAPTAIETCCTVAWMALTLDYLRLTGDPIAADELELSTLNGGLGAQHPSGRWWTYNTPMDGVREASAHTIVFQSRAGTPELNCCSVNAPRVLGALSEWAAMRATNGIVLNWHGPGRTVVPIPGGGSVKLACDGNYPFGDTAIWTVERVDPAQPFAIEFRAPGWSTRTRVRLNANVFVAVPGGTRHAIYRQWQRGDRVELRFERAVRAVAGANEATGRVSLYHGPVLLAFDPRFNPFDEDSLPPLDLDRLRDARVVEAPSDSALEAGFGPWLMLELSAADGRSVRLVDFASAGASGTRYRSWLSVTNSPPPPALTRMPRDAASVRPGPTPFRWRAARRDDALRYRVEFATNAVFEPVLLAATNLASGGTTIDTSTLVHHAPAPSDRVYWRVVSVAGKRETIPDGPAAWFRLDPAAPAEALAVEPPTGPGGELVSHSLRGEAAPAFGAIEDAKFSARTADGTSVNGRDQRLVYRVPAWPEGDFTVSVRVRVDALPDGRIAQVFSAWNAMMDDPLRLVVDKGQIHARVEAGGSYGTPGAPVKVGTWLNIAAVKRDGTLTLWVDGRAVGSVRVPDFLLTQSTACALGGNPRFPGNEFLAATFSDFVLLNRALDDESIARQTRAP